MGCTSLFLGSGGRFLKGHFPTDNFHKKKTPTPNPQQNRGGIQVWKKGDELDTGNVVNHENTATLILLIQEVPGCALFRSLKLMGKFTPPR